MKHSCIILFAFILLSVQLQAQIMYTPTLGSGKSKTEDLFDGGYGNTLRHRFVVMLKKGNSVTIQTGNKEQFEALLNLDSLILQAARVLKPLQDSFQNPVNNRRVDILFNTAEQFRIRHKEYPPKGNTYVSQQNELSALKVEQDTIVLTIYDKDFFKRPVKERIFTSPSSKITILVNNITDLASVADGTINQYMQKTKTEWDQLKGWSPQKNYRINLSSLYNAAAPDSKLNRPLGETSRLTKHKSFAPYVQLGIQNVNNLFTTSAGAGFVITKYLNVNRSNKTYYQLFWEPYFFFDRTNEGGFRLRRNDFVTFQYVTRQTNEWIPGNKIEFSQNISVGYLVRRSGDYFYKNTMKIGLPGAHYKQIMLYPEFIFNDLFKHFQPGLKLVLDLD